MTLKQLQKKLNEITPVGAINRARRAMIIAQINQMTNK